MQRVRAAVGYKTRKHGNGLLPATAPGSISTMDLSKTRRDRYDVAGTLVYARRRNDVTHCDGIDVPPHGSLGYVQI